MITVIFLVSAPFCKRDYQRYGMDVFLKNEIDIYVWDLTFALYSKLKGILVPPDPIEWERHIVFESIREVITALNKCGEATVILSTVPYAANTWRIFYAISKQRIPYITTVVSTIPPLA